MAADGLLAAAAGVEALAVAAPLAGVVAAEGVGLAAAVAELAAEAEAPEPAQPASNNTKGTRAAVAQPRGLSR